MRRTLSIFQKMTAMIINLIKIRILQTCRGIRDIGLFRAIFLLLILVPLLILFLYNRLSTPNYNHIITGIWLIIVLIIHRSRKDYSFLFKISDNPFLPYLSEYLLFSVPFMIMLAITGQYLHIGVTCIVLVSISLIKPSSKAKRIYSSFIKYLPDGLFEWQSGFRKNFIPLLLFYLIGFLGIYKVWFSAISVFLLTITICSFYSEYEPRKILESSELSASKFIKTKLLNHTKSMIVFILPIFIISMIHIDYWLYVLISFFVVINLLIGVILLKYAYYYPNVTSRAHQFISSIAILLSVILPFSIILVFANILLYNKSLRNLNNYLNAYN